MRKILKKVTTIFTAGVLAFGAISLAACGTNFTPLKDAPAAAAEVKSNGGFVVEKGDYVYFVNGVETYTSDNTYGAPVKGALMRVKKSNVQQKKNEAETVVPSLMVASDYTAGIFIYGDRVYYATPNSDRNMQGVVENSYLNFNSAKLDGSDVKTYFNVSSNSTVYRYVEVDGTVYLLYVENSNLHSYNTASDTDTELARSMGAYVLNSLDKSDPYVYYTMSVTAEIDSDDGNTVARSYNQIYRVCADATEAPYEYTYDPEYLEANDGEVPYLNLGEIVLDGIGSVFKDMPTQFTHESKTDGKLTDTPETAAGFTYSLQSYTNGGIYFTRSDLATTGTVGEDGWLYYLSEEAIGAESWNSITGNKQGSLDVVAQSTTNASTAAIFYKDENGHHYLYTSNSTIFRADVKENGLADVTRICICSGSPVLSFIDDSSDSTYKYVYYTISGNIYRAVYNGTADNYNSLNYDANKPYQAAQVLKISHAQSWYNFELIDGIVYFADAETLGSSSYTYISAVDLKKDGKLMDNAQLAEFGEEYEKAIGEDSYYQELTDDGKTNLATAVKYYFYTGQTQQFYDNIKEAEDETGKKDTLYSEDEVKTFEEFAAKEDVKLRSDFITQLGKKTEADEESISEYWRTALQHYTAPTETESKSLPAWAWALIGIAIGLVVVGAGVAVYFMMRSRKKEEAPAEKKMFVDTTDDEDVDVYATDETAPLTEEAEEPAPAEEAEAEVPAEEPAPTEEAEPEVPAEEPAPEEEPVPETPAEETAPEVPAEEPAPVEEAAPEAPAEEPAPEQKPEE